jgi:aryl-alcohol dehydrogenase-like predicted oxidoreductase
VNDDESIAAIRRAIEGGVNWVDTAPAYGLGHSEQVVGRALEGCKVGEEVFVFTKCGQRFTDPSRGDVMRDLRPESIRYECEESLKRLNVETIDLYQFHWPDNRTGTPVEESWSTMIDLVEEGKVRWIGVSNFDVDLLERCEALRPVDSLQPPLNILDQAAIEELIPWAQEHGAGVLAYSPLASGLLTGKFDRQRIAELARDDWRRESPDFTEPKLSRNLELINHLKTIADRLGGSLTVLAIAWVLSVPGVTGAIVGARRPEQVEEWLLALQTILDEEGLDEIERLHRLLSRDAD